MAEDKGKNPDKTSTKSKSSEKTRGDIPPNPIQKGTSEIKPAEVGPEKEIDIIKNQFDLFFVAFQHYTRLGDYFKITLWVIVALLAFGNSLNISALGAVSADINSQLIAHLTPIVLLIGWIILVYIESKVRINMQFLEFLIYRINSMFPENHPPIEYTLIFARFAKVSKNDPQELIERIYWFGSISIYLLTAGISACNLADAHGICWAIAYAIILTLLLGLIWWLTNASKTYELKFRETWLNYFGIEMGYRLPKLPGQSD